MKNVRIRKIKIAEARIALYKKSGFEIEGIKRHSLIIGDEFINEYYMSKIM
ncbi:hypothetical protein [Bacillus sp. S10(2024)]|uniref:hypothetical protein n=1 Tax=Bacillus sp. S10(2024) TaxID=3162886 RepID=UPI003D20A81C